MDVELLRTAAAMAVDYAMSVDDRRVTPDPAALAVARRVRRTAARPRCRCHRHVAPARHRRQPGDRRLDRCPLLRLRDRGDLPGRSRQLVAVERVGPERRAAGDVAGGRHAARRRRADGSSTCCGSRPGPASPSSPVPRWPTPRASPPAGTPCSAQLGWDAQADGLFGAPAFDVVVGERAHSTLSKSLGLVGPRPPSASSSSRADDQGRMRAEQLPDI